MHGLAVEVQFANCLLAAWVDAVDLTCESLSGIAHQNVAWYFASDTAQRRAWSEAAAARIWPLKVVQSAMFKRAKTIDPVRRWCVFRRRASQVSGYLLSPTFLDSKSCTAFPSPLQPARLLQALSRHAIPRRLLMHRGTIHACALACASYAPAEPFPPVIM
jgi:hypothetical protein